MPDTSEHDTTRPDEVLTMGRMGVDIYPLQVGTSLRHVETFGKFLGGSPANVAVAAARLGRRSAVITRTGADPFGEFLHDALRGFYRLPTAPDLQIHADELDLDAIRDATIFWVTVTGLSQEPSREATLAALRARGRRGITILDLDYRPMFWSSREEARHWVAQALPYVTVTAGNVEECETAVGLREPRQAAKALHDAGVDLAIVKQGPAGVLASDGNSEVEVPPVPVDVVNGLGAGDAFGGALCHTLLAKWDLQRSMRFCNAAGAIVASRLACADAMPTEDEVEAKLAQADTEKVGAEKVDREADRG
ncbi:MAG: IolC protein [Pseudonocardia sp.]|nr:IolC protein [Pseudonocardia sp.]